MAFRYVIDGYNLLYAFKEIPPGSLEQKRDQVLAFLKQRQPQGNNPVTVVFDSREGMGSQSQVGAITVIFTAGETADDRIGALVRETANPRSLVVVSNDRGIQNLVKGTGARFLTADEFLKTTPAAPAPPDRKGKPPAGSEEITEEFKKKWL